LYEFIEANQTDRLATVVASTYVDRSNGGKGPEGLAHAVANLHRAYSDFKIELADLIADDDLVAVRWIETGRHTGPFFNLKPTGRPFEARGVNLYRLQGDQIVESWIAVDPITIRAQQAAQQALAAETAPASSLAQDD
jgi:predicted ester cyclase